MVMNLKMLFIKSTTLVVALALGLVACTIAYAVIKIAWLALGVGALVTAASAWRLLASAEAVALAPAAVFNQGSGIQEEDEDLRFTHAGSLVDMNTPCGQTKYTQDLYDN